MVFHQVDVRIHFVDPVWSIWKVYRKEFNKLCVVNHKRLDS